MKTPESRKTPRRSSSGCDAPVADRSCGASPQNHPLRGALTAKHPHPATPPPPAPGGGGAAKTVCGGGVAATLFLFLLIFLPSARAAQLTPAAPQTLTESRITRTVFEYVMQANVTNSGTKTARGVLV